MTQKGSPGGRAALAHRPRWPQKPAHLIGSASSNDAPKSGARPQQNLSIYVCRMPDRPSKLAHLESPHSRMRLPSRSDWVAVFQLESGSTSAKGAVNGRPEHFVS
jgi:hypothetical protein